MSPVQKSLVLYITVFSEQFACLDIPGLTFADGTLSFGSPAGASFSMICCCGPLVLLPLWLPGKWDPVAHRASGGPETNCLPQDLWPPLPFMGFLP